MSFVFISYTLVHLFHQLVETVADEFLNREFRRVYKFAKGEIFRSDFVDTQILHFVDIESDDCFNEVFGQNIHRQYAVVFARHDDGTFAALYARVDDILFFLAEQPREVTVADAVFP